LAFGNKKLIYLLQHALGCVIVFNMSNALKAKIKQRTDFDNPAGEAMLNLMAAADVFRAQMDRLFAAYEITSGQYNVLRILRGAGCEGHSRCEIAARMVERAPDITRLVDRLEKQELVFRERSDEDRRQSITRVSEKGLELLDRIEPDLSEFINKIAKKMSATEWIALTSLCEKVYTEQKEIG
jgi:DNA-binding MarR family transcriptional regulator